MIIPVRDMAPTLGAQLTALAHQRCANDFEVIVVDNGSTDDFRGSIDRVRVELPDIRVETAGDRPSSGHARNIGAAAASSDRLLFCDGDDIVSAAWVDAHVDALDRYALVTGPLRVHADADPVVADAFRDFSRTRPPLAYDFLPYALSCNLAIRREVFESLNGFDAHLRSGADLDLTWRAQIAGHGLGFAPSAVVRRHVPATALERFRREARYARTAPELYARFASHGMPRSSLVRAAGHFMLLAAQSPLCLRRSSRYRWAGAFGHRVGRLVGSVQHRCFYP